MVLYAPASATELMIPAAPAAALERIQSLTRNILWPMAGERTAAQILNRVRLKRSAPLLPYRILYAPLLIEGRTLGLIAALRTQAQSTFADTDIAALEAQLPALQQQLSNRVDSNTALLRRPAFETEVALRALTTDAAALVYADLDQTHVINEMAGFAAGDNLIRAVGQLWQARLPINDGVATRLSGDRYAAVLFNHTLNQARNWAEAARTAIEAMKFDGRTGKVTASMGVALMPRNGSFERALAAAETACRAAKEHGRNRVESYESGDASMVMRHRSVRDSRHMLDALDNDRFALHAQPIVDLASPAVPAHYELLLRVIEPDGSLISIAEYLASADRYQLLGRLDRWVIEHALQALAPHAAALVSQGIRFAVNLTGQSLSDPDFAHFVHRSIQQRAVPAALLAFEFTETAAVRDLDATQRFVGRMTDLGAHTALDDFGTGLSSLVHLKELAVQQIKIDGQFIRDVLDNARSAALVRALVQIAEQLDLETVAEFVENEATARWLREAGVRYAQGHLYGRARPLPDLLSELLDGERAEALLESA